MTTAQVETLKRIYAGPMSEDQVQVLRDIQGFVDFCIDNGLSFQAAIGTLAHDVNGILQHQDAKWFMPKSRGYARIARELPSQLAQMAEAESAKNGTAE